MGYDHQSVFSAHKTTAGHSEGAGAMLKVGVRKAICWVEPLQEISDSARPSSLWGKETVLEIGTMVLC